MDLEIQKCNAVNYVDLKTKRKRLEHTYRECATDHTGSAFRIWIARYYTTGRDHGNRSLAANLAHLVRDKKYCFKKNCVCMSVIHMKDNMVPARVKGNVLTHAHLFLLLNTKVNLLR